MSTAQNSDCGTTSNPAGEDAYQTATISKDTETPDNEWNENLDTITVTSFNDELRRLKSYRYATDELPHASTASSLLISDGGSLTNTASSDMLIDGTESGGEITFDMLVPSGKVGLVIGKSGKNIKTLQERSGARLKVIQQSNAYDGYDKTLRITGPVDLVQHARLLVCDIIGLSDRNATTHTQSSSLKRSDPSKSHTSTHVDSSSSRSISGRIKTIRYPVPRISVGLIIGRGGETVKKIRAQTGAKVEFDQITSNLEALDEQVASITGKPDEIHQACLLIQELVRTALKGVQQQKPEASRDRSWNNNHQSSSSQTISRNYRRNEGARSSSKHYNKANKDYQTSSYTEKRISVPAAKVSQVLGTGQDVLREIGASSGVYCYMESNTDRGSRSSLEHHERMIVFKGGLKQVDAAADIFMKRLKGHSSQNGKHVKMDLESTGRGFYYDKLSSNREIGQGDPNALHACGHSSSSDTAVEREQQNSERSEESTSGFSQWLEYFQPERQQAQADAWEQKVKAEQDRSETFPGTKSTKSRNKVVPTTDSSALTDNPVKTDVNPDQLLSSDPNRNEYSNELSSDQSQTQNTHNQHILGRSEVCLHTDNISDSSPTTAPNQSSPAAEKPLVPAVEPDNSYPATTTPAFPVPLFAPNSGVITLYYDINHNSVVVLNQWPYA